MDARWLSKTSKSTNRWRTRSSSARWPPVSATATSTTSSGPTTSISRAILGHEPAGVVEAVGDLVAYVKPGDHVIACLSVFCGTCEYCLTRQSATSATRPAAAPKTRRAAASFRGAASRATVRQPGSFAEKMLLHENGAGEGHARDAVRAAPRCIGCGVTTGVGAALNTAKVRPDSTVAVFGAGGVGLSAIQGARIAGARRSSPSTSRNRSSQKARSSAPRTPWMPRSATPVREDPRPSTGGGVDYSFEAIGVPKPHRAGLRLTAPRRRLPRSSA